MATKHPNTKPERIKLAGLDCTRERLATRHGPWTLLTCPTLHGPKGYAIPGNHLRGEEKRGNVVSIVDSGDRARNLAFARELITKVYRPTKEKLRQVMTEKGIDLSALVNKSGVSRSTIGRFARDDGSILLGTVERIAGALGAKVTDILGGIGPVSVFEPVPTASEVQP
jgi:DNA-binding Xre family transcriptional regulator